nr:unnamed protein product [Ipomoea batatas]
MSLRFIRLILLIHPFVSAATFIARVWHLVEGTSSILSSTVILQLPWHFKHRTNRIPKHPLQGETEGTKGMPLRSVFKAPRSCNPTTSSAPPMSLPLMNNLGGMTLPPPRMFQSSSLYSRFLEIFLDRNQVELYTLMDSSTETKGKEELTAILDARGRCDEAESEGRNTQRERSEKKRPVTTSFDIAIVDHLCRCLLVCACLSEIKGYKRRKA